MRSHIRRCNPADNTLGALHDQFKSIVPSKIALLTFLPNNAPYIYEPPKRILMTTITIQVPDNSFSAIRKSPAEFADEMCLAASLLWYSQGEISQSKAAEMCGVSRAEFIRAAGQRRIPLVQESAAEALEEMLRE